MAIMIFSLSYRYPKKSSIATFYLLPVARFALSVIQSEIFAIEMYMTLTLNIRMGQGKCKCANAKFICDF